MLCHFLTITFSPFVFILQFTFNKNFRFVLIKIWSYFYHIFQFNSCNIPIYFCTSRFFFCSGMVKSSSSNLLRETIHPGLYLLYFFLTKSFLSNPFADFRVVSVHFNSIDTKVMSIFNLSKNVYHTFDLVISSINTISHNNVKFHNVQIWF